MATLEFKKVNGNSSFIKYRLMNGSSVAAFTESDTITDLDFGEVSGSYITHLRISGTEGGTTLTVNDPDSADLVLHNTKGDAITTTGLHQLLQEPEGIAISQSGGSSMSLTIEITRRLVR